MCVELIDGELEICVCMCIMGCIYACRFMLYTRACYTRDKKSHLGTHWIQLVHTIIIIVSDINIGILYSTNISLFY